MASQAERVQQLLESFPARPFDQKILDDKVAQEVCKFRHASSPENVRSRWELVLRTEVFALAVRLASLSHLLWGRIDKSFVLQETEGKALKEEHADYYNDLENRLDLVLTFTEQGSRTWSRLDVRV